MDKIFGWIGDLFTKIWRLFKKVLPYVMIALAAFFTFGGSIPLLGMVLEGYAAAVAAMGLSFLVAPDETIDMVTSVASDVGKAAGAVVSAVVGGAASGLSGGDNSLLLLVALGVGTWWLLSSKPSEQNTEIERTNIKDERNSDVIVGSVPQGPVPGGVR